MKKDSVGKSYATWGRADAGPLRIKSWGPRAHHHAGGASGGATGSTRATSLLNIFMHSTAGGALEEEQANRGANKAAG